MGSHGLGRIHNDILCRDDVFNRRPAHRTSTGTRLRKDIHHTILQADNIFDSLQVSSRCLTVLSRSSRYLHRRDVPTLGVILTGFGILVLVLTGVDLLTVGVFLPIVTILNFPG
ncbi:hypothetical protein BS47DRAFT_587974 [Hydnum rufescens UP504]|uniref:Uncharacterized protein n=1 Tax=Hydnum rufescens UP504 TaxID=1448309 RepID=A0A9P6B3D4_9AGAM|nr:hypothetical protein BS47DRAFT_587974 [Hydnum rufescens UP504]